MNETCFVDLSDAFISPVILRGDNYAEWSTSIQNLLRAKQKIGFIDGSIPKRLDKPDLILWLKANFMITDWILETIDPKIYSSVDSFTVAKDLWDTLQRRLSIGVKARVYQLKVEINAFKQNGQTVESYFLRLCDLWGELHCYKSTRDCSCHAAEDIMKEKDDELVYQFLMGLDDSLKEKIAFIIVDKGPLPDLGQAYSLVITEEKHLRTARSKELQPEPEEQLVKPREEHNSCSHCGHIGHKVDECYALHGYPESRHARQKNKSTRGRRGKGTASSGNSTNTRERVKASPTAITNQPLKSPGLDMDKFNAFLNLRKLQDPESNIYSAGPSASSSNHFPMAQKMEAKGGNGGKIWDDGAHEGISQIYIREGSKGIESIKFDYVKNEEPKAGPTHSGSGYSQFTEWFDLNHTIDEHIICVKCYFDEGAIQGLKIKTNIRNRTTAVMGYNVGTTFKLEVKGKKIIGFHGSFDNTLKSLGAYFTDLSPANLKY